MSSHKITEKDIKSDNKLLECDCGWSVIADNKFVEAIKNRHTQDVNKKEKK